MQDNNPLKVTEIIYYYLTCPLFPLCGLPRCIAESALAPTRAFRLVAGASLMS